MSEEELYQFQGVSRYVMEKLDEARAQGRFGVSEIALLREKLSLVIAAFGIEKTQYEGEFFKVGDRVLLMSFTRLIF